MTEEHTKITKPGAQYFRLVDSLPTHQRVALREKGYNLPLMSSTLAPCVELKARWNGEKRSPKAGEWYLSGGIVEAYRAQNDLPSVYHIAEVVIVKTVTTVTHEVIETLPPKFIRPPDMRAGDTIEYVDGLQNRFVVERVESPDSPHSVVRKVSGRSSDGRRTWFCCGAKSLHRLYSRQDEPS